MNNHIEVATSGTVPRGDTCVKCGQPMSYRVACHDPARGNAEVVTSFCGNLLGCEFALVEFEE